MSNNVDPEKLRAAKEKLACHIEPPKGSAYAEALAKSGAVSDAPESTSAQSCDMDVTGGSCGEPAFDSNKTADKIRLTEMTSAGG